MSFLFLHLFLLNTGCNGNSSLKADRPTVKAANGMAVVQDTLTQIANGQIIFSNGTTKALPFANDPAATVLILVRHAEPEVGGEDPEDPELNSAGKARAERLADILQNFPLAGVYTDYFVRATKTAQPCAYQQQLDIQFYDQENAADFIVQLAARQIGKNALVVGSANTVPKMLNRLFGESKFSTIKNNDYSDIFIVSINKDGESINIIQTFY